MKNTLIKTNKTHCCECCGRTIPVGVVARLTEEMVNSKTSTWYSCIFCVENMRQNYVRDGEAEVISEDFEDWAKYTIQEMHLNDVCSTCNEPIDSDNWTWASDKNEHETKIILECDECGDLIFEIDIPIDVKEEK